MPFNWLICSTRTRSSTACIRCPTRPNSTTGQWRITNRASDVPPPVDITGTRLVSRCTARATRSVNGPGGVRKLSPYTRVVIAMLTPNSAATLSASDCNQSVSDALVWMSLKRILTVPRVSAGMTLVAVLPVSIVVTARVDGSKCALPLSLIHI